MRIRINIFLYLCFFMVAEMGARLNVEWPDTVKNLGLIEESAGAKTTEFYLVNKSRKKVRIREIQASCGCTEVTFDKRQLSKGDTAVIKVQYDPQERPSKFDKGIYVYLNEESLPEVLKIKGTVMASEETLQLFYPIGKGSLRFETDTIDFSEVKRGLKRREFLDIYNAGKVPVTPEIKSENNALTFDISPATLEPGETATITMYLDSSRLMWLGHKSLWFDVIWKDRRKEHREKINVEVTLLP